MTDSQARWQDLPIGGVIVDAGNAAKYLTGGWRTFRPIIRWENVAKEKGCTRCLICWLYCPESAMMVADGVFIGVDFDHCKGCGICEQVCPGKCITMVEESQFLTEDSSRESEDPQ